MEICIFFLRRRKYKYNMPPSEKEKLLIQFFFES